MSSTRIGTFEAKRLASASWLGRPHFTAVATALLLCGLAGGQALADCNSDIGALSKKRQDMIDELNKAAKKAPKGQLDPATSCPKLRALATAELALLAYLKKNKDWCVVPDEAIKNFQAGAEKSKSIASKACAVAEQIKKGLEQSAAQAPKLPTGPL